MKVIILTVYAAILAFVTISTWMHPVLSAAIIIGSAVGAIMAGCARIEKEERV